ncbi:MAG: Mur ligase domain-containing protein [Patescibacteria group bacterium]
MSILDKNNFHFIGIGGIGTSGLAQILRAKNKNISGSDQNPSEITQNLENKGVKVFIGHSAKNLSKNVEAVIFSPAIPLDNPELLEAKKRKLPCLSYPQALGELTKQYYTIAISGTHGKSTTTAMIAIMLTKAGLDPTVIVGTKLREFDNQNFRVGKGKYLVIEACEYKNSFLNFHPQLLVITNVEADHLDFFKNLKNYQKAFLDMAKKVPKDGLIILGKDKFSEKIAKVAKCRIKKSTNGKLKIEPGIPGKFNIDNATNAATVGLELEIPTKIIEKAIKEYGGSWRRMEYVKTKLKKTIFIDDYGHHPTEIKVTLEAIRSRYPKAKILCIFQPHQHSRTRLLLKDFAKSFSKVDQLIIPNIYEVRDSKKEVSKITTDDLVKAISRNQKNTLNGNNLEATANYIKENHGNFDVIVTMGAGDIAEIYKFL